MLQAASRRASSASTLGLARRGAASGAGFEVLHRSRIPTLHFQASLPKLPVPALSDTLERMLYSAEPLMGAAELEELRAAAGEFASGDGPALQEALVARDAAAYSSYISQPWFELYLRDRRPLLLNYNPQLTFVDEEGAGRQTQAGRAARLVHGATTFLRTLESGALEPDVFHTAPQRSKTRLFEEAVRLLPQRVAFYGAAACGAYPLDMSQYDNLFRSTRLPHAERDTLVVAAAGVRHIVVQRGGRFWSVDVLTKEGASVPLAQLQGAFEAVIAEADAAPAADDERLGLLTTLPRDEWATVRGRIEAEGGGANAASLAQVDSALFMLSLDAASPEGTDEVTCPIWQLTYPIWQAHLPHMATHLPHMATHLLHLATPTSHLPHMAGLPRVPPRRRRRPVAGQVLPAHRLGQR